MLKDRRSGSRSWTRGLFAFFWIVLAGFSGLYLFTVFADPTALGGQAVALNPLPIGETPAAPPPEATPSSSSAPPALTAEQASELIETNAARDNDLAEIKTTLRELSEQMAEFNTRLKPIEKVIGPVASLPSSASVTTSPPDQEPLAPAAGPPTQAKAAPPPPAPPPPEPKPVEAAKPVEQAAVEAKPAAPAPQEVKPAPKPFEPPSVAVSPLDDEPLAEESPAEESADSDASAPDSATAEDTPSQSPAGSPSPPPPADTESAKPAEATESAALDPVTLPPAANDGTTRYGIEIGIVAKQDGLRPLWREFLTNHSALVAGLQPRRVLAPDKKWRLVAGPFANSAEAAQACALFKKASRACEPTVYAGDGL
jgi:sporulation related protein